MGINSNRTEDETQGERRLMRLLRHELNKQSDLGAIRRRAKAMRGNTLISKPIQQLKNYLQAAKALIVTKMPSKLFNEGTKSISQLANDTSSATTEAVATSLWIVAFLGSFLIRARAPAFMVRILKRRLRWTADVEAWMSRETRVGVVWEAYAVIIGFYRLLEFARSSMHFLSHHLI